MVWCGVVGYGRAGQFLSRFHFAVNSTRPQMGLNSCHRDPEVLVQVDLGSSAIGACALGDLCTSCVNLSGIPTGSYDFFLTLCVPCII